MTQATALIGHTGFVGGNLLRQTQFDDLYNSSNIESIAGRHYGTIVCSGAPAEKWKANQAPEQDRESLGRLKRALGGATAGKVILISTVDVYPSPQGVDESTPIDLEAAQPYGRHRLELERFVADHFEALIVRLPGLFGPGLKKNIIFDFLHDNLVDKVHSDAVFQFYDLQHLWRDITTARAHDLPLVNFATEPTSVADVAQVAFGRHFENRPTATAPRYDVRSQHAALFGGHGGYLHDRDSVLDGMAAFVRQSRAGA